MTRKPSSLESLFESQLLGAEITGYQKEFLFCFRAWRFDFAWPKQKIAIELEGAVHANGRHTRGTGFEEDCHKYNTALMYGWKVIRATRAHVNKGMALAWVRLLLRKYNKVRVRADQKEEKKCQHQHRDM